MKPLSSRTRALFLGFSLFLPLALTACGGGEANPEPAAKAAPVLRCAP